MKAYKKILASRRAMPIVLLIFVGILLATSRADALINVVSTFIDMMGNNIYNVGYMNITGWLNGTSFNGTYYGNGSGLTGIATYNSSYDTYAYNQTAPAISWAQGQSYQTGTELWNTSTQMVTAINATNYYQIKVAAANVLNPAWLTAETEPQWAANYSAFNTTWATDNWNTTTQVRTAVNSSGYYNLSVNNSAYCNGLACANPAGNTSTQVKSAVNDTADQYFQITAKNMTSGLPFSFLNKPGNCSSGQWINGTNASGFLCAAPTITETDPTVNDTLGKYYQVKSLNSSNTTSGIPFAYVNNHTTANTLYNINSLFANNCSNTTPGIPFSYLNKPANCSVNNYMTGTNGGFDCDAITVLNITTGGVFSVATYFSTALPASNITMPYMPNISLAQTANISSISCASGVMSYNNATGVPTCEGGISNLDSSNMTNALANISTTTCTGTDKVSGINNATGAVTCSADQTSGSSISTFPIDNFRVIAFAKPITFATTFTAVGFPAITANGTATNIIVNDTPTNAVSATQFINYASPATQNLAGGIYTANDTMFILNPRLVTQVLSNSTNSGNRRIWVALEQGNGTAANANSYGLSRTNGTLPSGMPVYIGVRYDTSAGDTHWMCCSGDGTTGSCVDTGMDYVADYTFGIDIRVWNLTNVGCHIQNNTADVYVNKTTNLPTTYTSQTLMMFVRNEQITLTNAARHFKISWMYLGKG